MIYMDHPKKIPFRGQERWHAHLWSNLPGDQGYRELMGFAVDKVGLKASWIQCKGTHKEHFDLLSAASCKWAIFRGAEKVRSRVWAEHTKVKRLT